MCLEDKELKNPEADKLRKEASQNLNVVTTLLSDIMRLAHLPVEILNHERRHKPR